MRINKLVKSHTSIGALHVSTVCQKPNVEGHNKHVFRKFSLPLSLYECECVYVCMYVYMYFDMTPESRNSGARVDIHC
jgi:hypothetical protein